MAHALPGAAPGLHDRGVLVVVHDQHGARRGGCRRERGGRRHQDPRQRQSSGQTRAMTGAFAGGLPGHHRAVPRSCATARARRPGRRRTRVAPRRRARNVEDALARHGRDAGPLSRT